MNSLTNKSITFKILLISSFILLFFAFFFNEFIIDLTNPHHPLLEITKTKIRESQLKFLISFFIIFVLSFLVKKVKKPGNISSGEIVPNILLSVMTIFLIVFILENTFYPFVRPKTTIFMEDVQLGWKLKPNSLDQWGGVKIKINQKGLRGTDIEYKKPKGIKRILFLGDSITFGYMLGITEKTFPYLVQNYINKKNIPENVQCINAGVGGYSPWQEFIYLKDEGIKYDPDLVVVGFVLNDITEKFLLKRFGGIGIGSQLQETIKSKESRLRQNSSIYNALLNFIAEIKYGEDVKDGAKKREIVDLHKVVDNPYNEKVLKAWELTLRNLEKIIIFCRKENIEVLMVVFPYTFQFDNIQSSPQSRLKGFSEQQNISFIDMLPIFAEKLKTKKVSDYFLDESHLTYKGHEETAKTIADYILNEDLLKK